MTQVKERNAGLPSGLVVGGNEEFILSALPLRLPVLSSNFSRNRLSSEMRAELV